MENRLRVVRPIPGILLGAILLAGLYLSSLHTYLLFHSLIELFTITVAAGIFVIAWNARSYLNTNYLLFVGISAVFVALLDLIHTLAYKGMGVFADPSANPATQLWLAARYLQSLSLIAAPFLLGRRLKLPIQLLIYTVVTALLFASIYYWRVFPVAYVEGSGLTPFKKISEYVISAFFLIAIGLLLWKRREFDPGVIRLLILFLAFTIASEMAFSDYVSVYGGANLVGHFLRLASYYFLYKAIIETGLVKPYDLLLRNLKRSEDRLREHAAALQTRNDELDAYAHTVAHNLKNPLSVIIMTSDAISDITDLTSREQEDFMQQIRSTAYEMDNIIDNLLLLAEVRKAEAPQEPVDMAVAVAHIRKRLGYLIKEHHARISFPKTWPVALGYAPWVEEVWANYLSNAMKYGGRPPCIQLGSDILPNGMIRFWVRDDGPGLTPEARGRLFIPFTQLSRVHTAGHGLGLSIVSRIIEKLGGRVGVESEVGRGSLFFFTLPGAPSRKTGRSVKAGLAAQKLPEAA